MRTAIQTCCEIIDNIQGTENEQVQFKEFVFFTKKNANNFEQFLINSRLHLFTMLHMLNTFDHEDVGFVANTAIKYWEKGDHMIEEPTKTFGPSVLEEQQEVKNIFNHILQKLDFSALLIEDPTVTAYQRRKDTKGIIIGQSYINELDEVLEEDLFFVGNPTQVIITQKSVLINKENKEKIKQAEELLGYLDVIFVAFLEKYKDDCVPHEVYVDWLWKWFPGRIKVKSIEQVK